MLEFGAMMGVVLLGAQPGTTAIAFLAGSVAGFVLSFVVLRRTVPWSTFRPKRPDIETLRELTAPGLAFMALPIGNALSLQGFTIVIGTTLGAAAVVVFSTTRTITRVALQAMGSINLAIWPELSRSVGSGRLGEARAILRRGVQLAVVSSISLVFAIALFGPAIIRWWTRGLIVPPPLLLDILLLVILANSIWYTHSAVLVATNRHMRMAIVYLSGTVAALLVSVPLSSAFGLTGAAVALLAIDVVMVAHVFPAALRVTQDTPSSFLRALIDVRKGLNSAVSHVKKST